MELKKLIIKTFNINSKYFTLEDNINHLAKYNFKLLSKENIINKLHEIRKFKNKITSEKFRNIYTLLIDDQVLKFISWNLSKIGHHEISTKQKIYKIQLHLNIISASKNSINKN